MTKKDEFIEFVKNCIEFCKNDIEMSDNAQSYWKSFQKKETNEKTPFTEKGKQILIFLKEHLEQSEWKAKEIGEGLFISSRGVSGAMQKLIADGYVEKVGQDPVIYALTETGKNVEF